MHTNTLPSLSRQCRSLRTSVFVRSSSRISSTNLPGFEARKITARTSSRSISACHASMLFHTASPPLAASSYAAAASNILASSAAFSTIHRCDHAYVTMPASAQTLVTHVDMCKAPAACSFASGANWPTTSFTISHTCSSLTPPGVALWSGSIECAATRPEPAALLCIPFSHYFTHARCDVVFEP